MSWAENWAHGIVEHLRKAWEFLHKPVPRWLRNICVTIGEIVFMLIEGAGKEYIQKIENYIIETSETYATMSGDEKFNHVWDFAHKLLPEWKESDLDGLIQSLFLKLKNSGEA